MAGLFQPNVFQNDVFQIEGVIPEPPQFGNMGGLEVFESPTVVEVKIDQTAPMATQSLVITINDDSLILLLL